MRTEEFDDLDIRPGVAVVLFDAEGRVLLHRRRVGDGWAPPSGHVEPGETLLAALHREIGEETGLSARVDRLVSLNSDPAHQIVAFPDGRRVQFVTALFACTAAGGTLAGAEEEGTEWGWFAPDALPAPLLPYARVWLADALAARDRPVVR